MVTIDRIDHLVLTVADIDATCDFYERALGMKRMAFGPDPRVALAFGRQKINLHRAGAGFEPKAARPTPGSGDLCFITAAPIDLVVADLKAAGIAIIEGPVARTGAIGPMTSVYLRDPDGNLVEIARYD
ncbi:MAG: VOC family protein [Alphaproteobacteria bacterium]|nr:VOC family protein [Alphaproteobacteria bacterium]